MTDISKAPNRITIYFKHRHLKPVELELGGPGDVDSFVRDFEMLSTKLLNLSYKPKDSNVNTTYLVSKEDVCLLVAVTQPVKDVETPRTTKVVD